MNDMMTHLGTNIVNGLAFAALGVVLFIGAFFIFDKLTPGSLWKELIEDENVAVANLMGCVAIALAIIIAAAIV